MIQSMTGFGRGEASNDHYKVTVEMKTVNHRYLDISVRMPHKYGFFEGDIRSIVKQYASRGKVDVFVAFEAQGESDVGITYNKAVASAYLEGIRQMALDNSMRFKTDAYRIARLPEVFTLSDSPVDVEEITPLIQKALSDAGTQLTESRGIEGKSLADDIIAKLDEIKSITDKIEERYPEILTEYSDRIRKKAEELLADKQIDERVLASEMVIYADKLCIDEEMVRLKTHIDHMRSTLDESENIGRKLDFLTQELNREANTILSKSTDITIANYGIELKTLIEKIREQIQNIE